MSYNRDDHASEHKRLPEFFLDLCRQGISSGGDNSRKVGLESAGTRPEPQFTIAAGRWHNFLEVRSAFKDADNVKGYVIFNIRQNRYRLVTIIHYARTMNQKRTQGHVYIRSFLTHKEYDNPANWDRRFGTK
jgi:mRNA interferase HigB